MNIGLIIMCISGGMLYITLHIVPLICLLLSFAKEERGPMDIDDWLFAPLILIIFLIPIVGALMANVFCCHENKWYMRIAMISLYIFIIGFIIAMATI